MQTGSKSYPMKDSAIKVAQTNCSASVQLVISKTALAGGVGGGTLAKVARLEILAEKSYRRHHCSTCPSSRGGRYQ
jgi:hypothetical protein